MKTYKTLDEIFTAASPYQVNAQELLNGRTRLAGEWQNFKMPLSLRGLICQRLAEMFGGVNATKERVYTNLMNENRKNKGLERVYLVKYKHTPEAYLHFVPYQSAPEESKEIRNALKS